MNDVEKWHQILVLIDWLIDFCVNVEKWLHESYNKEYVPMQPSVVFL